MKIYEAMTSEKKSIKFENTCGEIAADYIYAYPPDIPLIVPGETITDNDIFKITEMIKAGLTIIGIEDGKFKVVEQG